MSFTVPFGGTVAERTIYFKIYCSGRFDDRVAVSNKFKVIADGSKITIKAAGEMKAFPMVANDDRITITLIIFECNGVKYRLEEKDVYLRNAIRTSNWLSNSRTTRRFTKDITTGSPNKLINLYASISGLVIDGDIAENINWVSNVTTVNSGTITPYDQMVSVDNLDPANATININAMFDEEDNKNQINDTCKVAYSSSNNTFAYKGINYLVPDSPATLADFITT